MNVYELKSVTERLSGNPYVGRGIIVGKTEDGKCACAAYFIMGRSANSRNRVFKMREGVLYTEPFDASKVQDPSLIIYAALRSFDNKLIVTNGDQTDTVFAALKSGGSFRDALATREFEPDAPNLTPRISALLEFEKGGFSYEMSILKSADESGAGCNRFTYSYAPVSGVGHFLHTYVTDGEPLPSFCGEPERVAVGGDIDVFTRELWDALDEANRIALYVRYTELATGEARERIINKNCGGDAK